MTFFLNKLKEQASSIQTIAKNMMVYEHGEGQEGEEIEGQSPHPPKQEGGGDILQGNNTNHAEDFFNSFLPSL